MIPAVSSALQGISLSLARLDRAARVVSGAGGQASVDTSGGAPPAAAPGPPDDLAGAMVDVLMAQRAFSAQLRVLETADEMSREAVNLPRR